MPLKYACGILRHPRLPMEIFNYIISYLPLMRTNSGVSQVPKYLTLAQAKHPAGLAFEDKEFPSINEERKLKLI